MLQYWKYMTGAAKNYIIDEQKGNQKKND